MIIKKEIREFKKIYSEKSNYGIIEWKKEQKEHIKKIDNTSIKDSRERMLLELMYEKEFGKNEIVIGKDLLLQFAIVISSIISSTILAIMVFLGDVINGFISKGDATKDSFWDSLKSIVEEYVRGTLDISLLVITIIAVAFFLLLIGELLFAISKIIGKKDILIIRRYYECIIELLDEEIKYRDENGIFIKGEKEQFLNMKTNLSSSLLKDKMKMLKEKMKKYWLHILLLGVILFSLVPVIVININFEKNKFQDDYNIVEESMGVYVEWLGALSPLVLGVVAISQSDRIQKLEEKIVVRDNSCNIMLEDKSISPNGVRCRNILTNDGIDQYEKSNKYIVMEINNYSNAFLKEIEIVFGENVFHSNLTVVNNKGKMFKIILPKNYEFSLGQRNRVIFTSCYNVKTYGDFIVCCNRDDDNLKIKQYHFWGIDDTKLS